MPGEVSTFGRVNSPSTKGVLGDLQSRDELSSVHAFWHAAYLTLLEQLPIPAILEFFHEKSFWLEGRRLEGSALFEHLYHPQGNIPLDWNYRCAQDLELFLCKQGVDSAEFLNRLLQRNNIASYMPGSALLSRFYPQMEDVFDPHDSRVMVLARIQIVTESYMPGHPPKLRFGCFGDTSFW
jgi:hypothetical protein